MTPSEMTETELALELQYVTAAIPHLTKLLQDAVDSRAALMAEKSRREGPKAVAA